MCQQARRRSDFPTLISTYVKVKEVCVCHRTYLRYRFGCQDAKTPGGVLRWVELPAAEVELVRQRGGEDHSNHVQVVSLVQRSVTVPQTLGDLKRITKRCYENTTELRKYRDFSNAIRSLLTKNNILNFFFHVCLSINNTLKTGWVKYFSIYFMRSVAKRHLLLLGSTASFWWNQACLVHWSPLHHEGPTPPHTSPSLSQLASDDHPVPLANKNK